MSMKMYFKDPYGCTASIEVSTVTGRSILRMRSAQGALSHMKEYKSERSARIALGRLSEGLMEPCVSPLPFFRTCSQKTDYEPGACTVPNLFGVRT